jgi:glycosyltransferase involved in cell wall biosynthesis
MRILCIIDSLGSGGAQRQIVGLSKLLQNKKYDVLVAWYHQNSFYKHDLDANNIRNINIPANGFINKIAFVRKLVISYKPDVLIAYLNGPAIIASLLKFLGYKFYLIVSERNTNKSVSIREKVKFFLYKWADSIVSNSFSQADFIMKSYPLLYKKTTVITNFSDTKLFRPIDLVLPRKSGEMNLLVVARIVEQKNVLTFIGAIKQITDKGYKLNIDWYGKPFSATYFQECLKLVEKFKLSDSFHFYNETTNIVEIYNKADVFCLPSLWEGYPNVICEAMACGLPILCSNICDNPKIVSNGINGLFFDPNIEDSIANCIISFLEMDNRAQRLMKIESRKIAEYLFSEETFVNKYIRLFPVL